MFFLCCSLFHGPMLLFFLAFVVVHETRRVVEIQMSCRLKSGCLMWKCLGSCRWCRPLAHGNPGQFDNMEAILFLNCFMTYKKNPYLCIFNKVVFPFLLHSHRKLGVNHQI